MNEKFNKIIKEIKGCYPFKLPLLESSDDDFDYLISFTKINRYRLTSEEEIELKALFFQEGILKTK